MDQQFTQFGSFLGATAENGTWIPTVTFATPGDLLVVYAIRTGVWSRLGNQIFANFRITTTTFTYTTSAGLLQIVGFPFVFPANTLFRGNLGFGGITKAGYTQFSLEALPNASTFRFNASGSAQTETTVNVGDVPSAGTVTLSSSIFAQINQQ